MSAEYLGLADYWLGNDDFTRSRAFAALATAHELHTANLQTERAYLRETTFDRKLSDREEAIVARLDAVIAERLGIDE